MKLLIALSAFALLQLAVASPIHNSNKLEFGELYEGDMILQPGQKNGLVDTSYRWPDNTIPYTYASSVLQAEKDTIDAVLQEYAIQTCIKVVPRTNEADYVIVTTEESGCWSYVGRLGGSQELNLAPGCQRVNGTILHEFLHALGFYHMQSDPTRDDFVIINLDNVLPGYEHNFDKYSASTANSMGVTYDYNSVMHYPRTAFAIDSSIDTITPIDSSANIGQRLNFSPADLEKLQIMYPCS